MCCTYTCQAHKKVTILYSYFFLLIKNLLICSDNKLCDFIMNIKQKINNTPSITKSQIILVRKKSTTNEIIA